MWNATRLQCARCGRFIIWKPADVPDNQSDEQFAVEKFYRASLGRKRISGRPARVSDELED